MSPCTWASSLPQLKWFFELSSFACNCLVLFWSFSRASSCAHNSLVFFSSLSKVSPCIWASNLSKCNWVFKCSSGAYNSPVFFHPLSVVSPCCWRQVKNNQILLQSHCRLHHPTPCFSKHCLISSGVRHWGNSFSDSQNTAGRCVGRCHLV